MAPGRREIGGLVEATTHGLRRLQPLVTSLSADSLHGVLGNGWTAGVTLAHLAFAGAPHHGDDMHREMGMTYWLSAQWRN
jgi:hypothetical protein